MQLKIDSILVDQHMHTGPLCNVHGVRLAEPAQGALKVQECVHVELSARPVQGMYRAHHYTH